MSDVVEQQSHADLVLLAEGFGQHARWANGERLENIFEDQCDDMGANGLRDQPAVDGEVSLTYDQLDRRGNQLARFLLQHGVRPGDRVSLLFDQGVHSYVAMLGVLKVHAAYVPLDAGFPPERLAYITSDAGVRVVLTLSHLRDRLADVTAPSLCLDEVQAVVGQTNDQRLSTAETGMPVDQLCYIIYTSGSTGWPKGVAVEHPSICNFVRVAAELYGYQSSDRVYQGMTIAFDFSVEEIWVPLLAGATLVPKPAGSTLLGYELAQYVRANRITALCCVPTLLATVEEELPDLRFLLVSGEACPQDLVARWYRPGRRFLNVYGPTEATVTATWALVHPDRPVTLGIPLPTYSTVILDPTEAKALARGEMGEIGIAGPGLAVGYVNRDDLTSKAFIPDFLGIEGNPSNRIYRTGDLGLVNSDGEIEYHGRIDTQVKIRGYRIELIEIESLLMQAPGIAQAVVNTYEPEPGRVELVAYFSRRQDADSLDEVALYEQLRRRLPAYMVPAYFEELSVIPMLASDKADRKSLPVPRSRRSSSASRAYVAPRTPYERILAGVVADVLQVERVSVDANLFDDLGANSLLMAHISARGREHARLPDIAIRDIYQHPTVAGLARHMEQSRFAAGPPAKVAALEPAMTPWSTTRYLTCGALQLLIFLGYAYGFAVLGVVGYRWVAGGTGLLALWGRAVLFGAMSFVILSIFPVVAKWLLIGRWRVQEIPVWSLAYVKFWLVKTLVIANPMALFVGSPLYSMYLRALGAQVGKGVLILSRSMPVCTDLLSIGEGAVIGKDTRFQGYRAVAGVIQTGHVTIGQHAFIGPGSVLDIETHLGNHSQLGHASALHAFQSVPARERWHGVPARSTETNFLRVESAKCSTGRRAVFCGVQLLNRLGLTLPIGLVGLGAFLPAYLASGRLDLSSSGFLVDALLVSLVIYFGGLVAGLVFVLTVPRLLARGLREGAVYPLYGLHYFLQRLVARLTNVGVFLNLFGDSSLIIHYLRLLGYDVSRPIEQTGSNFGAEVSHESPYLCTIGRGTMVSDGLAMINTEFSSTSFRMARTRIGAKSFFGNGVLYPSDAAVGQDCLFGTRTMVPIDGEIRQGVGLLGSPCFEIPRSVRRDGAFEDLATGEDFPRRLAAKLRHNLVTMALYLFVRWLHLFVTLIILSVSLAMYRVNALALMVTIVVVLIFSVGYFSLAERAAQGFRRLQPRFCSIYDPTFWRHERFWKMIVPPIIMMFSGTPYKNVVMRLLGVRVGRRVFDDGCFLPEKTLVSIGDDCTLNGGTVIQCHSMEEGAFKLDAIAIESGCTVGVAAYVHYAVTMGASSVIEADSFVMKGSEVGPGTRWSGNPASVVQLRRVGGAGEPAAAAPRRCLLEPAAAAPRRCLPGRPRRVLRLGRKERGRRLAA